MKRRFESTTTLAIVCIMWAAAFAPRVSWPQLTTATISGTVTDKGGAVIPDAQVTIVNQDTNAQISAKTNSVGNFVLAGLSRGNVFGHHFQTRLRHLYRAGHQTPGYPGLYGQPGLICRDSNQSSGSLRSGGASADLYP